mgnify:CR=1 FL=1
MNAAGPGPALDPAQAERLNTRCDMVVGACSAARVPSVCWGMGGRVHEDRRSVTLWLRRDQAGPDEKVLAVPVDSLHPFYEGVQSYKDLPPILRDQTAHFFQHYKDLEKGKWTQLGDWVDTPDAERLIMEAIAREKKHKG